MVAQVAHSFNNMLIRYCVPGISLNQGPGSYSPRAKSGPKRVLISFIDMQPCPLFSTCLRLLSRDSDSIAIIAETVWPVELEIFVEKMIPGLKVFYT